jgi:tetratricopeptide (TPR) repeat protein
LSKARRDPCKQKERRERIRLEKAARNVPERPSGPPPKLRNPFAAEQSLRDIHAAIGDRKFKDIDEANAFLNKLTAGGRVPHGPDTPEEQARDLAYEAMSETDGRKARRLVRQALKIDPNCVDALRLQCSLEAKSREDEVERLSALAGHIEGQLGEAFFAETKGHFWGEIETRPYMRVLNDLAFSFHELGREDEAIGVFERMLELNPSDNQGVRYPLTGIYLAGRRYQEARSLFDRFPEEQGMTIGWGRVLERYASGDINGAERALKAAREWNPHVEAYWTGTVPIPAQPAVSYRLGSWEEAAAIALDLLPAWQAHPESREWVRKQGK